jgi:HD superfamily phosphohydrolase
MREYEIRDPVYGFIGLDEWEKQIIGHPAFQRLRRIRQLALTDMVYPGAMHTRFEHSLGVMHLATLMYAKIVDDDTNFEILKEKHGYNKEGLKKDRRLIRLAALLHDVGHAPFSHPSGPLFPAHPSSGKRYEHEDYTAAIIKGPLKEAIEDHQINKANYNISAKEVAGVIEGNLDILGQRAFWKELISSQLDADRADYLLRDSLHAGVKYGIYDHWRLLNTIALAIDPEDDSTKIGIDEGGWHVAEAIVLARYQMFTQVYFHKTRRAYDYHLKQAMAEVLDRGELPTPKEIDKFLELDDITIINRVREKTGNPDCSALIHRNHIRMLDETPEVPKKEDEQRIKSAEAKLQKNGLWCYVDKAEESWYKRDVNEGENKEIKIVSRADIGKSERLASRSRIVDNIGGISKMRIYVRPEDRNDAREVLR